MGEKTDHAKGHIKDAIGTLTGDEEFKREARKDRLSGDAKEKLGDAKEKVDEVIDKTKDATHRS